MTIGVILIVVVFVGCSLTTENTPNQLKDKCDVGQDWVGETDLDNYNCEDLEGCEWQALGGKLEMQYACCPQELPAMGNADSEYSRCFVIID